MERGYTATCANCGRKRDPLKNVCETCGEDYDHAAAMSAAGNPRSAACRKCGRPIVWIQSAKTGKAIPCNPRPLSVVTNKGRTVQGRIVHFATCPKSD